MSTSVRPCTEADGPWRREVLESGWGSTVVARKGAAIDARDLPGFVVEVDGERRGLVTYRLADGEVEVVTIQTDQPGAGFGRALMDAVTAEAERLGATRLWLITTDNNARAIRFYGRYGLRRCAVYADGVAASRRVKPTIPAFDGAGVAIRDELEFEVPLPRPRRSGSGEFRPGSASR